MKYSRILSVAALAALVAPTVDAQVNNAPPGGGPGRGRGGAGVEASVASASARSPEVNANNTITFRLLAPNAKKAQVFTDMPKLGEVTVHGSSGYDMTKDEATGVWSYTTPKLTPSYYQYWFVVDGLTTPDPQNTFVRPGSGVYKSIVALPGKEAEFMMFRDVPHGDLIEHHYFNPDNKTARRVVIYTPPGYSTSGKSYPVIYLLHGANDYERGWTQSGMANNIMDNLIADGKAVPAIIVMPFGHDTTGSTGKLPEVRALQASMGYTPPAAPARGAGRGAAGGAPGGAPGAAAPAAGAPAAPAAGATAVVPAGTPLPARGPGGGGGLGATYMEKDLLTLVIPYVEKEFRVIKDKDHRAIMGYSMGGGHSASIGLGHPEIFSYVGMMSGGGTQSITNDAARSASANKDYKMLFVGSGTEDNAINGARSSAAAMKEKGIKHILSEDEGYGHDYQIWRQYFYRLAQQTFRD